MTGKKNTFEEASAMQWIVSLAISVVCCASLFVVFAGYIMDMHKTVALLTARWEVMEARQNNLSADMDNVRRATAPLRTKNIQPALQPVYQPAGSETITTPQPAQQ